MSEKNKEDSTPVSGVVNQERHDDHDLLGQRTKSKTAGASLDENPNMKLLKPREKDTDDSL